MYVCIISQKVGSGHLTHEIIHGIAYKADARRPTVLIRSYSFLLVVGSLSLRFAESSYITFADQRYYLENKL